MKWLVKTDYLFQWFVTTCIFPPWKYICRKYRICIRIDNWIMMGSNTKTLFTGIFLKHWNGNIFLIFFVFYGETKWTSWRAKVHHQYFVSTVLHVNLLSFVLIGNQFMFCKVVLGIICLLWNVVHWHSIW